MKIQQKDAQDLWFQLTQEEVQVLLNALHLAAKGTDDQILKQNIKTLAETMMEVIKDGRRPPSRHSPYVS